MVDVIVPEGDGGAQEAYVVEWFKDIGERIEEGEAVVELMTDKANLEVPAPCSGVLASRLFEVDDRVSIGEVLARITPDD